MSDALAVTGSRQGMIFEPLQNPWCHHRHCGDARRQPPIRPAACQHYTANTLAILDLAGLEIPLDEKRVRRDPLITRFLS